MVYEWMRFWRAARGTTALQFLALAWAMTVTWPGTVSAQSASQITPHTFAPIQGSAQGGITIGEVPDLEVPAGADTLFVT